MQQRMKAYVLTHAYVQNNLIIMHHKRIEIEFSGYLQRLAFKRF